MGWTDEQRTDEDDKNRMWRRDWRGQATATLSLTAATADASLLRNNNDKDRCKSLETDDDKGLLLAITSTMHAISYHHHSPTHLRLLSPIAPRGDVGPSSVFFSSSFSHPLHVGWVCPSVLLRSLPADSPYPPTQCLLSSPLWLGVSPTGACPYKPPVTSECGHPSLSALSPSVHLYLHIHIKYSHLSHNATLSLLCSNVILHACILILHNLTPFDTPTKPPPRSHHHFGPTSEDDSVKPTVTITLSRHPHCGQSTERTTVRALHALISKWGER